MAYIVGVMLIFVFLFGHVGHASLVGYHTSVRVEDVIGPVHGALYIVYLLTVLLLWRRYRLPLLMLVLMVAAGWLPFTAFIGERAVVRRLQGVPEPAI
jgi:integral membrane protein